MPLALFIYFFSRLAGKVCLNEKFKTLENLGNLGTIFFTVLKISKFKAHQLDKTRVYLKRFYSVSNMIESIKIHSIINQ